VVGSLAFLGVFRCRLCCCWVFGLGVFGLEVMEGMCRVGLMGIGTGCYVVYEVYREA